MLPAGGHTKTEQFLDDKKSYATVYVIGAVYTAAQLKITDSHNRAITFTSGDEVKGCSTDAGAKNNAESAKKSAAETQVAGNGKKCAEEKAALKAVADAAPGGGGQICQNQTGVVEIKTPEGTPVAMSLYRLWWADLDHSWNLVRDDNKSLPAF